MASLDEDRAPDLNGGSWRTGSEDGGGNVSLPPSGSPRRPLARPPRKKPASTLTQEHQDALVSRPVPDLEAALVEYGMGAAGGGGEGVVSPPPVPLGLDTDAIPPPPALIRAVSKTQRLGQVMEELMVYHSHVVGMGLDVDLSAAGRVTTESGGALPLFGGALASAGSSSQSPHGFHAFKLNLTTLLAMGFGHAAAQESLFRTRNQGVDLAVEWLLEQPLPRPGGQEEMKAGDGSGQRRSIVRSTSYDASATLPVAISSTDLPPPVPVLEYSLTSPSAEVPVMPEPLEVLGTVPRLTSAALKRVAAADGEAYTPPEAFSALVQAQGNEAEAIAALRRQHQAVSGGGVGAGRGGKAKHAELAVQASNCAICWDDLSPEEGGGSALLIPGCGHTFCKDCVRQWLTMNITEGRVGGTAMRCPLVTGGACDRGELIQEEVEDLIRQTVDTDPVVVVVPGGAEDGNGVSSAVVAASSPSSGEATPPLLEKYRKFLENRELEKDPRVRWCPSPGCETAIRSTGLGTLVGQRRLKCPKCSTAVCGRCGRAYHGWGTCENVTDATLEQYRKQKFLQPCPNCRRQVEKLDACPHMTCPCGHQWCWVCRGNYPCSALHFGKSGYGSSTEIGDVSGIQRLAVIARMFTVACFLPLLGVILGLGGAVWGLCLGVGPLVLFCTLVVLKAKDPKETWDDIENEFTKSLVKLIYYAYAGLAVLAGGALGFALLLVALGLLHVAGVLFLPFTLIYLVADAVYTLKTGVSSLDLSIDTTDEDRFGRRYSEKGGALSQQFVGYGRFGIACLILAVSFVPALAFSLCIAPLAPCLLIPICISPRDEFPKVYAMFLGPLAALGTVLGLGLGTSLGWSVAAGAGAAAFVLVCLWLCIPPLSNCAFCAPVWIFSYSLPLAFVIGSMKARKYFAFAPVPDFPIQLPFILVLLACGVLD
uniref:RBR-type E3 ubiquitin transferase n=1 Tax=Rhizochromulina marina TaxID=1034831 RepID=A0A7S2RL77_9STRA